MPTIQQLKNAPKVKELIANLTRRDLKDMLPGCYKDGYYCFKVDGEVLRFPETVTFMDQDYPLDFNVVAYWRGKEYGICEGELIYVSNNLRHELHAGYVEHKRHGSLANTESGQKTLKVRGERPAFHWKHGRQEAECARLKIQDTEFISMDDIIGKPIIQKPIINPITCRLSRPHRHKVGHRLRLGHAGEGSQVSPHGRRSLQRVCRAPSRTRRRRSRSRRS